MTGLSAAINTLAAYCGPRELPALTPAAMQAKIGKPQADVAVLFGGTILAGAATFAAAMRANLARRYVIVGGHGHTTDTLFATAHRLIAGLPEVATEAELFAALLARENLQVDALERRSTNCGNNIANLLALLRERGWAHDTLLLMQDATMQRRMSATLALQAPDCCAINYATYAVQVADDLRISVPPLGMWSSDRFVSLLTGEIARLHDTATGYGPNGLNYLAHVDVPEAVLAADALIRANRPDAGRTANPAFK